MKPSQEWQAPWQSVPGGDHPRQLTGAPSLGVLYSDLPQWNEVYISCPIIADIDFR